MSDRGPNQATMSADVQPNSIHVVSPPVDERTQVLKHGDTFAVLDRFGDIREAGMGEEGVYHYGCRFLSHLALRLAGRRLLLLGSAVHDDNAVLGVDLTNPDVEQDGELRLPKDTIHVHRSSFLFRGEFCMRLDVRNYARAVAEFELSLRFRADFTDLFEVRGVQRKRKGERSSPRVVSSDCVELEYRGLDRHVRCTRMHFAPTPDELAGDGARFAIRLQPNQRTSIDLVASFDTEEVECERPGALSFDERLRAARDEHQRWRSDEAVVHSSNEHFNAWLSRSTSDLHLMMTETPQGPYPYAGVPWFSTPFGRDGLITALMVLWFNPEPARGVLRYLAASQATHLDPSSDAEPGKILHEARYGEVAGLDEIPFRKYYGTIDATPLFVILAGAYYRRTADREMLQMLWPHVERSIQWIDRYGDRDGDGFVEYLSQSKGGIQHQGWKDSNDSVFHADGRLAEPPIALCEVQGYVYAARREAARLARALGKDETANELWTDARRLQERFETSFWSDELETYVLALDGEKQPCAVRSSNAGQCLFSGIASRERARRVAEQMLSDRFFSGWGVRTIAEGEARYNPMSYHNGSIWPHDNALIAAGLARYDLKDETVRLLESIFQLSLFLDLHRLPELFCGFPRREGAGPTLYPVACSPQAWAAASVFLLLKAALGLDINAEAREISFDNPRLPPSVRRLTIERLPVGEAEVDLEVERYRHDVGIKVLRRTGDVNVSIRK